MTEAKFTRLADNYCSSWLTDTQRIMRGFQPHFQTYLHGLSLLAWRQIPLQTLKWSEQSQLPCMYTLSNSGLKHVWSILHRARRGYLVLSNLSGKTTTKSSSVSSQRWMPISSAFLPVQLLCTISNSQVSLGDSQIVRLITTPRLGKNTSYTGMILVWR